MREGAVRLAPIHCEQIGAIRYRAFMWLTFSSPLLALISCAPAADAPSDEQSACLNIVPPQTDATVAGKLTIQLFAGPPNYESIASGDAEEQTLILELPERMCANDGDFIEPSEWFDRVQLSSEDPGIRILLNSAVGRDITVRGEAFGSHTGHHHAPLVMLVEELSVR